MSFHQVSVDSSVRHDSELLLLLPLFVMLSLSRTAGIRVSHQVLPTCIYPELRAMYIDRVHMKIYDLCHEARSPDWGNLKLLSASP